MHTISRLHRSPFTRLAPLLAIGLAWTDGLAASTDSDEVARLKAELVQIQARLDALEQPPPPEPAKPSAEAVSVKVDRRGLVVESPDKSFNIRVRPRIQIDGLFFPEDSDGSSGFTLRRVRPVIQGDAGPVFWRFMPELAGTVRILDAWGTLELTDLLSLQAGKFKGPVGYERLQSFSKGLFMERGLPSVLTPTREIGLALNGSAANGVFEWTAGVFNGVLDDTDQSNNGNLSGGDYDFGARLAIAPFKNRKDSPLAGLSFGFGATIGDERATIDDANRDSRIRYRTSGRNTFFRYNDGVAIDGERHRLNPFLSWYQGPFGFLTEYVQSSYELARGGVSQTVDTDAWTIQASWVVTGENASYKGVRPKHPFSPASGAWGALELGLRYHTLEVGDEAFAGDAATRLARGNATQKADAYGVAINWILTDNLLVALNYEVTDFSGLGAVRDSEEVILSRFQIDF